MFKIIHYLNHFCIGCKKTQKLTMNKKKLQLSSNVEKFLSKAPRRAFRGAQFENEQA